MRQHKTLKTHARTLRQRLSIALADHDVSPQTDMVGTRGAVLNDMSRLTRFAGNAEREEQMTRAELEEMVEAQLPEFYKMLLGDAETVVIDHSGFSDDEIALLQRLLVAEVSGFDFQRTQGG